MTQNDDTSDANVPQENGAWDGEEPRYGVRLPGYGPAGQKPAGPAQGGDPSPVPDDASRPGWDASPRRGGQDPRPGSGNEDIPVMPSGVHAGYPHPGFGGPHANPPRPGTATSASVLLWIGAALYAVVSIIGMLASDRAVLRDTLLQGIPDSMRADYERLLTPDMLGTVITTSIVFIVILSLFAALVGWFTFAGSAAWRVVGTVCGALAVLGNLVGGTGGLLWAVLSAAIVVLWWVKPSSAWFAAMRPHRRAGLPRR